jgi:RNA polymerase sigma-70 factor (ECF subfamily)
MDGRTALAERFEAERPRLRAVAYRMLGSLDEAEDAVQETWLRLERADAGEIENLRAWLTTVCARISLNLLRARGVRREEEVPDPLVSTDGELAPEQEAMLADAVGLALLVVLDTLAPAERLAFVLHDMFAVPFGEIAPLIDRTPAAARQLASRGRRRVASAGPTSTGDPSEQRRAVDAFFAAARNGDLEALVAVLHPDVLLRSDGGPGRPAVSVLLRGAERVAGRAMSFARLSPHARPVLVNGLPGMLVAPGGKPFSVMAFTVVDGLITRIDSIADPARLVRLGV